MHHWCFSTQITAASLVFALSSLTAHYASAFILNNTPNNNAPLPSSQCIQRPFTFLHSSFDSTSENDDSILEQVTTELQNLHENLLSNPSKLQPIIQQHSHHSSSQQQYQQPSNDTLAKETLLSTRLSNISLNRTYIAPSNIVGGGRGLFAIEDIRKGELITCYPGDALLCEYIELDDDHCNDEEEDYNEEEIDWEDIDFEDEDYYEEDEDDIPQEVILWGDHVDTSDRMEEDMVFDGDIEKDLPPLTSYAASVDDVYSVMGMPTLDTNPAYYGQFANDGAGHIAIQTGIDDAARMGIEEVISMYVRESVELSNAVHKPIAGGLHLGTFATKDVRKGEEILVTYGTDYWMAFEG